MKKLFGILNEGEVYSVTLENGAGMRCTVITLGCILQSLYVPDKCGKAENVVLGYNSAEDYRRSCGHFGEVVGRCCNRIGNSTFTLDGIKYTLPANDGKNHLHGGPNGFGERIWEIESFCEHSVTLSLISEDGDMGYPGRLCARCTYTLSEDSKLIISYEATTDKATPVCLTNHSYFDLCGAGSGRTLDMLLRLDCDRICNTSEKLIPDGTFSDVAGTPYDFRTEKAIGHDIGAHFGLLRHCNGYDTNYFIKDFDGKLRSAGRLSDPVSGRSMEILTDLPCIQLYTGNMIGSDNPPFYGTIKPGGHMGVCLETQVMPDAVNHPGITDTIIRPGEKYSKTTVFDFGA